MASETFRQQERILNITTPLGKEVLLLSGFTGEEHLSGLFSFHLDLLAKNADAAKVKFESLLGKEMTVECDIYNGDQKTHRHLNGLCISFTALGVDEDFHSYRAEIVPRLWLLTRRAHSRIFQRKSVPDILKEMLARYPGLLSEFKLQGTYEKRDYCVQYAETDFNFISRLMEEEGIFYCFRHTENDHTLVVLDSNLPCQDVPGQKNVEFDTVSGSEREGMHVHSWQKMQYLRAGKYTLWDNHFQLPGRNLEAQKIVAENLQIGQVAHKLKVGGNEALEIYEYPGHYAKRFDGIGLSGGEQSAELEKVHQDNARTVNLRLQAETMAGIHLSGSSNCLNFCAGHKFNLKKHPDAEGEYLLSSVRHSASGGTSFRSGGDSGYHYSNTFQCLPVVLPFRPARVTPHPFVNGVQTATVVGQEGSEIFTDKYGRVKVQFNWDRDGKKDANSSCWLRVATAWAGKQWGMIHIPRIGQEVLVDFVDGDPDAPIIIGSVYHPGMMPPYKLPDLKTRSGIRSHSSLKGAIENFNEIRFEDKKGEEQLFINAEKDLDLRTENDARHFVGKDEHVIITQNRKEQIKGNDHAHVVGQLVQKIDQTVSVKVGTSRDSKIGQKEAVDAGTEIHLKAGMKVVIEAGVQISLKVGGNFIDIGPAGVTIQGTMVLINSGGAAGVGSGAMPTDPEQPDTADDGSKGTKLS